MVEDNVTFFPEGLRPAPRPHMGGEVTFLERLNYLASGISSIRCSLARISSSGFLWKFEVVAQKPAIL
jgi:hypothetical protein